MINAYHTIWIFKILLDKIQVLFSRNRFIFGGDDTA